MDQTCCICLNNSYNDDKFTTICKHVFHEKCIFEWTDKFNNLNSINCPMCRSTLLNDNTKELFQSRQHDYVSDAFENNEPPLRGLFDTHMDGSDLPINHAQFRLIHVDNTELIPRDNGEWRRDNGEWRRVVVEPFLSRFNETTNNVQPDVIPETPYNAPFVTTEILQLLIF